MKDYVERVFRKEKKPIDIEKLYLKVSHLLQDEKEDFLGLSMDEKKEIQSLVKKGVENYQYIETPNNRYISILKTSFRVGKFFGTRGGDGSVSTTISYMDREGNHVVKEQKYSITKDNCSGAIDGDSVLIDTGSNGEKPKIKRIIHRNLDNVMGEVVRIGTGYFVRPIDKKKQFLTIALEGEAIEGQRVAVDLVEHPSDNFYVGKITRVFSHKDDPDADILWEAFKCGINDQFSKESLEQVKSIPQSVRDIDKIGREDLTDWEIFTIDGEDTKDIDDAVSIKKLSNGNYLVGVHIADVSYYVPEGSPLDIDAYKRGTSCYLAGKVIPMLPHELSNGICSLNPHVERLALSRIMEVSPKGKVIHSRVTPTVIKSRLKMSYTKVNQILNDGIVDPEYEKHQDSLRMLNKLALILRRNRIKQGAVEFNRPELKLILDDDDQVVDFSVRKQDVGENLIEELMLLANEETAKDLSDRGFPCLYRVHGKPNQEKLDQYLQMLAAIGIPFDYTSDDCMNVPLILQSLVEHIKKTGRLSNMLSTNLVRCMSRAKYSPVNIGHSGLAKQYYCHFTSPIRRYADLINHRIIKDCCLGNKPRKGAIKWKTKLLDIGNQTSKMERAADDAERQVLAMKCSEYMSKHIGEIYEGTIIGVSDRAIQIQLDNMVEGRILTRDMEGDYVCNPLTSTLISLDEKNDYFIGDRLLVMVRDASKEEKTIDFSFCNKLEDNRTVNAERQNQLVKNKEKKKRMSYICKL